jgi:hypothetical protein
MTDKQDKGNRSPLGKRPYHPPQLLIYGDVNKLTRAKDFTSMTNDGSIGMFGPWTLPLKS